MQNKGHHRVHESKTFNKRLIWCKQTLTPNKGRSQKADMSLSLDTVLRCSQLGQSGNSFPRDPKHIRNKLRCDRNMHTSNASEEERYWTINPVHVGVKLLDKHERTGDRDVTQWLPSPIVNDKGKVGVGKVRQNDLAFRMNTSSRKVLRECLKGIIIMESDSRRRRISRWRSTGTKRVLGWSGFTLRCHRHD